VNCKLLEFALSDFEGIDHLSVTVGWGIHVGSDDAKNAIA
jgi:hypothetical protein